MGPVNNVNGLTIMNKPINRTNPCPVNKLGLKIWAGPSPKGFQGSLASQTPRIPQGAKRDPNDSRRGPEDMPEGMSHGPRTINNRWKKLSIINSWTNRLLIN